MKQLLGGMLIFAALLGHINQPDAFKQQESVEFRNPSVESHYPDSVTFRIEVCGRKEHPSTDFDYTTAQYPETDASGWMDAGSTFYEGQTPDGCFKQKIDLDTKQLHVPPFTLIHYYWSLSEAKSRVSSSPMYTFYYTDATRVWKTLANKHLIVRWHDRPDSFGQEVMSIASIAYQEQVELYHGSLKGPITIVITNTQEEFAAWRPEDNFAAGTAFSESYLTVQVVEGQRGYQNWLYDVIPHEISHIFFGNLIEKDRALPLWLNEGLATYQEYSDHWDEWGGIRAAYDGDSVQSLAELAWYFEDQEPQVYYAYAQSYYAILFMYEVYGDEAVSRLLSELSAGSGTNTAFNDAFGITLDQFESEYMVWLESRIVTPPPSTALPSQTTNADIAKQVGLSLIMIICFSPIFFVGFGALGLGLLWVLNDIFSMKEKTNLT